MKRIGLITGAGLPASIDDVFDSKKQINRDHNILGIFQPYSIAQKNDTQFIIMKRHGSNTTGGPLITPAEMVKNNVYEAIIYELAENFGVEAIFGFSRVGHVDDLPMIGDGGVIVPNHHMPGAASQHSFGSRYAKTVHAGMGEPFNQALREQLILSAKYAGANVIEEGTYFYHAGDCFETRAEIEDIRQKTYLPNKIVGMTVIPEVLLSAQMNTPYAAMCFSVNPAEGLSTLVRVSHEQTNKEMARGEEIVADIYRTLISNLSE